MIRTPGRAPRSADAVDREVGLRIAARRTALGLSQTALADRAGVSFQQIQKYESGLNRVSASRLHRIAQTLGTPVGDFFPDPFPPPAPSLAPSLAASAIALPDLRLHREGRVLAACFPRIADRKARRALTRLAVALAEPA